MSSPTGQNVSITGDEVIEALRQTSAQKDFDLTVMTIRAQRAERFLIENGLDINTGKPTALALVPSEGEQA
jgi:hypothetical protein